MSFDPNLPQEGTPMDAVQMRLQLNGLKALIDALLTVTAAQVDAVNTLPPGDPAQVDLRVNAGKLHFTFGLPQGQAGTAGNDGSQGNAGPQGPPFAQAVVEEVINLPPGSSPSVGVSFDGSNVRFSFSIPQGNDGPTGAQGPPGEVTQTDLNNGLLNLLNQTSNNSNGVGTLDNGYGDPETEELRRKLNELIETLRR